MLTCDDCSKQIYEAASEAIDWEVLDEGVKCFQCRAKGLPPHSDQQLACLILEVGSLLTMLEEYVCPALEAHECFQTRAELEACMEDVERVISPFESLGPAMLKEVARG